MKRGGNVTSCFCTPDGRVIHAVGGPINQFTLLQEAEWAVDVYKQMKEHRIKDLGQQANFVKAAHLAEFNVSPYHFESVARSHLQTAWSEYNARVRKYVVAANSGTPLRPVPSVETFARRSAARLLGMEQKVRTGIDQSHLIFAAQPMASVSEIGPRVFEELTGEKYVQDRSLVYEAAEGVELAKKKCYPLIFIFYKPDYRGYPSDETQIITGNLLDLRRNSPALRKTVIVSLPIREQPALTQLVDLPTYDLHGYSSGNTIIVIADSYGRQIVAEGGGSQINFENLSEGFDRASKIASAARVLKKIRIIEPEPSGPPPVNHSFH